MKKNNEYAARVGKNTASRKFVQISAEFICGGYVDPEFGLTPVLSTVLVCLFAELRGDHSRKMEEKNVVFPAMRTLAGKLRRRDFRNLQRDLVKLEKLGLLKIIHGKPGKGIPNRYDLTQFLEKLDAWDQKRAALTEEGEAVVALGAEAHPADELPSHHDAPAAKPATLEGELEGILRNASLPAEERVLRAEAIVQARALNFRTIGGVVEQLYWQVIAVVEKRRREALESGQPAPKLQLVPVPALPVLEPTLVSAAKKGAVANDDDFDLDAFTESLK